VESADFWRIISANNSEAYENERPKSTSDPAATCWQISVDSYLKFFGSARQPYSYHLGVAGVTRPGLDILKELFRRKNVPDFVPPLNQNW
jgi:hypothetical protein